MVDGEDEGTGDAGAGAGERTGDAGAATAAEVVTGEQAGKVIVGDPAVGRDHWTKSYPELADHPKISEFETPATLAKSYLELQTAIGKKGVLVPGEGASEEEMGRFYESLGRPESPDAYFKDWKPPEGLPWDMNQQDAMAKVFHEVGLTQSQAERIRDAHATGQADMLTSTRSNLMNNAQEAFSELQSEYGTAFEGNINLANRFGDLLMGKEGWESLMNKPFADGSTLGNHPDFIRAAVGLGTKMGETKVFGMGEAIPVGNTPDQANAELAKMKADPEVMKALIEIDHPEHKEVKQRYDLIYKQLYPPEAAA